MDIYPISADDHCWEKPDTFTSRVPAALRDAALHLEVSEGQHYWFYNGRRLRNLGAGAGALLPDRGEVKFFEEAPAAAYDARARLERMDEDGVAAEVLFPQASGFGGGVFCATDGPEELRLACCRAYNDYLAEEWAGVSDRYVACALLPMWDVTLAVAEAERAAAIGHRGVVWTSSPEGYGFPHFNEPYWDPLWATLQDLQLPVCLHIGGSKLRIAEDVWSGYKGMTWLSVMSTLAITGNVGAVVNLLFSGVLERFPALLFYSVESGCGWVPYLLETADHQYEAQRLWNAGIKLRPSEYFRRQVMVSFWFEESGVALRHMIGVPNMMWEADFPHPTSTYPHSRKTILQCLEGVGIEERRQMLQTNAERVFRLDLDPATLPDSVRLTV